MFAQYFWNWSRYRHCQIKFICASFRNRYKTRFWPAFLPCFFSLKYLIYDYRSYLKPPFNTVGRQTAGMCEEVSFKLWPSYYKYSGTCLNWTFLREVFVFVINMSSVYTSNINIGALYMFGLNRILFYSGCCLDRFHRSWNIGKTKKNTQKYYYPFYAIFVGVKKYW